MTAPQPRDILIGPRTTVFTLLAAYPFLEPFLRARDRGFEALAEARALSRWARIMTLDDVAARLEVPRRELVYEIAAEVERGTGRPARIAGTPRRIVEDERLLGDLRGIVDGLVAGASLPEAAARWRAATADLEPAEAEALDAALSETVSSDRVRAVGEVQAALTRDGGPLGSPPAGHPLESLRREAVRIRQLSAELRSELVRLGGSPTMRRWRRQKPLVSHLVDLLSGVESRFRREQQAWFPALGVHAVEGPQSLLRQRQTEALETLRRLRLAVARDDAQSIATAGTRLADTLEDLLAQDERLVEPLAERHFSAGDWTAVRELEEGVGWRLIPTPPPWPDS